MQLNPVNVIPWASNLGSNVTVTEPFKLEDDLPRTISRSRQNADVVLTEFNCSGTCTYFIFVRPKTLCATINHDSAFVLALASQFRTLLSFKEVLRVRLSYDNIVRIVKVNLRLYLAERRKVRYSMSFWLTNCGFGLCTLLRLLCSRACSILAPIFFSLLLHAILLLIRTE